jgi:hypothetical protein
MQIELLAATTPQQRADNAVAGLRSKDSERFHRV